MSKQYLDKKGLETLWSKIKAYTVFVKGDADNSAVLKDLNNKAISEGSVVLGTNNIVGLKGWYYKAIQFNTSSNVTFLYLSKTQQVPVIVTSASQIEQEKDIDFTLRTNDVVSVVNDSKYDNKYKISSIEITTYGCIGIKSVDSNIPFPFDKVNTDDELNNSIFDPEDYSIYCLSKPDAGIVDIGQDSFASGYNNKATNGKATAFGYDNHAYGKFSFVEGRGNEAGYAAHAEGRDTEAIGTMSHAEGYKSIVKDGAGAHAEGYGSVIDFTESTNSSDIPSNANKEQSIGAHVEGVNNTAAGIAVHVEGKNNKANRTASHAEGVNTRAGVFEASNENTTYTEGLFTHAEGNSTLARGSASHAEGAATQSLGRASHAEGRHSVAKGNYSHAEGFDTFAGDHGGNLLPSITNTTKGYFTHSEGHNTLAEGNSSHAEGKESKALGACSHAEGYRTTTNNQGEHASGKYNKSTQSSDASEATQFSIGVGTSDTDRKNAFEVKQNGDIYIEGVEGRIQDRLDKLVNVTHEELVNLRKNSQLIPGQQYRITDYLTTTTQSNTQSAGHQFDIIVVADNNHTLNEVARVVRHEGDVYFGDSDLNAWELKYCIDNDTNRFTWADATNGKGVIYYMKDEFNNECPYDFKNIQFARWELSNPVGYRNDFDFDNWEDNWIRESTPFDLLKEGFYGLNNSDNVFAYAYNEDDGYDRYIVEYTISDSPTYCYTFGKDTDYSMDGSNYGNVIKEYKSNNKIQLNNIVFLSNSCHSNSFGNYCSSNSFGNYCYRNSFGNNCSSNSFGEECYSNSFESGCSSNSFGNYCYRNSFGEKCHSNSFESGCSSNSFGNYCYRNSFGEKCHSNSFGNYCSSNSFRNYCSYNSFGNNCSSNSFGESSSNLKSYYRYIIFDNGNSYINLNCTSTTSISKYFQNVRIGLGVNNTSPRKTIDDSNVGQTYETLYKPANSQTITI